MTSIVTSIWKSILTKENNTINIIIIHHLSKTRGQIKDPARVRLISLIQQDHLVQVVNKDPTEEIMMEKENNKIIIQCND